MALRVYLCEPTAPYSSGTFLIAAPDVVTATRVRDDHWAVFHLTTPKPLRGVTAQGKRARMLVANVII